MCDTFVQNYQLNNPFREEVSLFTCVLASAALRLDRRRHRRFRLAG